MVDIPPPSWTATWLSGGSGPMLDGGERAEISVVLTDLVPRLEARKEFTIQVKPVAGAILVLQRTTPVELTGAMDLR